MGQILYQYDVKTPAPNADVDAMINEIRSNLPSEVVMQEQVEVKKLYFGIQAAVCQFIVDESHEGKQDELENFLTELDAAGEWELSFTTRL